MSGSVSRSLKTAFTCSHRGLEDVVLLTQVHDWAEEALGILHEGDENAEGDGSVEERQLHRAR